MQIFATKVCFWSKSDNTYVQNKIINLQYATILHQP